MSDITPPPEKKKRGRKPKPKPPVDENAPQQPKQQKRRGRRRKYEIENYERLLDRNNENAFDHQVSYSSHTDGEESDNEIIPQIGDKPTTSDEEDDVDEQTDTKIQQQISFGNLNIVVSKKPQQSKEEFRRTLMKNVKKHLENKPTTSEGNNFASNIKISSKINIDENEYSSDEDKELSDETISNQKEFEKIFLTKEKYITKQCENHLSNRNISRIRIVKGMTQFKKNEEFWPEKTQVWCWHCSHPFDNPPCFIPKVWDEKRKRIRYFGVFCSWSCAKTYNFDMGDAKASFRSELITHVARKLHKGQLQKINPAPPRQTLKVFGGYLTISEFREKHLYCKYMFNQLGTENFYTEFHEISNITKKQQKNTNKLRLSRPDLK